MVAPVNAEQAVCSTSVGWINEKCGQNNADCNRYDLRNFGHCGHLSAFIADHAVSVTGCFLLFPQFRSLLSLAHHQSLVWRIYPQLPGRPGHRIAAESYRTQSVMAHNELFHLVCGFTMVGTTDFAEYCSERYDPSGPDENIPVRTSGRRITSRVFLIEGS
jgi:hypothetical protein